MGSPTSVGPLGPIHSLVLTHCSNELIGSGIVQLLSVFKNTFYHMSDVKWLGIDPLALWMAIKLKCTADSWIVNYNLCFISITEWSAINSSAVPAMTIGNVKATENTVPLDPDSSSYICLIITEWLGSSMFTQTQIVDGWEYPTNACVYYEDNG